VDNKQSVDLAEIYQFLLCKTPTAWIDSACSHIELLLIDHANCEKKAASTALNLLYRYTDKYPLLQKMSRIAREELRHFEQVVGIMQKRGIAYTQLNASRYASTLHEYISKQEPQRIVDTLIVGAFIEARSCERFSSLIPFVDDELKEFYQSLLKSESRHYRDYLDLAKDYAGNINISQRVNFFAEKEKELVLDYDSHFRFHSGPILSDV
jgi:tRNA-(ms[2]io[6]A)-hydroxylase